LVGVVEVGSVEEAVTAQYATLQFSVDMANALRRVIEEVKIDEKRSAEILHEQLKTELARLESQEENLLDLVADGAMASPKAKHRLAQLQGQQERVRAQFEKISCSLAAGAALLEDALNLLENPQELYRRSGPKQRQLLNLAVFDKIYVIEDGVSDATYRPPFDELAALREASESKQATIRRSHDAQGSTMGRLAQAFLGDGLSKALMVEVNGLEP
jgi:site-specific DNA recombinase